jgi:predicted CoA-substrate-specific enzyme activase
LIKAGVKMSLVAGIDIGSTSTKLVFWNFNGKEMHTSISPTGWSPRDAANQIIMDLLNKTGYSRDHIKITVATGYGRIALKDADKAVTEITCHARGAAYLVPGSDTIIDIGGQDSKVVKITPTGKVTDFVMNDKCAAGTGRFLQVMATALGIDVSELGSFTTKQPAVINNMCTVFAESEVIGLLAQGTPKDAVITGLHDAVARRVSAMVKKLGPFEKILFTGGVALNPGVHSSLEKELGKQITVPEQCQLAGAIGAALIARDMLASD